VCVSVWVCERVCVCVSVTSGKEVCVAFVVGVVVLCQCVLLMMEQATTGQKRCGLWLFDGTPAHTATLTILLTTVW